MVTPDGAASYDVDGTVVGQVWDMGDGTTLDGTRVRHVYNAPGAYTVALSVTDHSGVSNATSQDRLTNCVNAPPVPVIEGPTEPMAVADAEPEGCRLGGATDPGGRADVLDNYVRLGGTVMLGVYAFPDFFPWAVITELSEENACAVVYQMMERILLVGALG